MPFFTNAKNIQFINVNEDVGRAQDPREIARQAVARADAALRNLHSRSICIGSSDASIFVNNHAFLDRTTTLAEGSQQLLVTNGSSFIVGNARVMSLEEKEELNEQLDAMRQTIDKHRRRNEQRIANRQGYRRSRAIPKDGPYPTGTSPWSGPTLPLFSYPPNGRVPSGFGPQSTFNHPPTTLTTQLQHEAVTETTQDNVVEDEELKDDRAQSTNISVFSISEQNRDANAATRD
ncbi:hypothetical protein AN958_06579 [Leucoagaricus sp. SymC.cos]|nr:hypothetical protein AN958_06579 [Leucoagaricus sp. SymC.cos]